MFRIRVQENDQIEEYSDWTAKKVWQKVIEKIVHLRQEHHLVKMFSVYITGEDLFGLSVKTQSLREMFEKIISYRNHM